MNHEFEDIEVKENGISLLEDSLKRKRKKCMIAMGSMTDPYIKEELELNCTRKALELVNKHGFGATLITKSANVLRDLNLLKEINSKTKCVIQMTLTTYDEALCKNWDQCIYNKGEIWSPKNTGGQWNFDNSLVNSHTALYNDTEENIIGLLNYCKEARVKGIICFEMGLTLRNGNREYFYRALDKSFPGLKNKYIEEYGTSYNLPSKNNSELMKLFHDFCDKENIMHDNDEIFDYLRTFEEKEVAKQLSMFD